MLSSRPTTDGAGHPERQRLPSHPPAGQHRYGALADALRLRLVAGEWAPGAAVPAESVLASQHGVALGTLRRAMDVLAEQGLIERRHGRGTFVRSGLTGAPMLRFFRFGESPGELPLSRILRRRTAAAPTAPAAALQLDPGEPALHLLRVRSLGGEPRLIEDIWLPLPLFAPLVAGDSGTWGALLYPLYAERCHVHVARAVDDIAFAALTAAQAKWLHLAAGQPCAEVARRAYDLAGRCVEWRSTRGDAAAFRYTVTIT